MIKFLKKVRHNDEGATAIEYGLIAALIALTLITALTSFSTELQNVFTNAGTELAAAVPADSGTGTDTGTGTGTDTGTGTGG